MRDGDADKITPRHPSRKGYNEAELEARAQRRLDAQLLDRIRAEHGRRHHAPNPTDEPQPGTGCSSTFMVPTAQPCPEYEVLANRLFSYAVPLFKSLLRTGAIKKELLDRSLPIGLTSDDYERLHTSMAARDALAVTVVIAGEEYFRRTIIPNMKWNADGGARLETFFVNGCLLHFATSVRSWRKEHPEWTRPLTTTGANEEPSEAIADPSADDMMDAVENRDLIDRLVAMAPSVVKSIMLLSLEGYSFAEIGEHLGLSARAVEGRLHRFRTQVKKDVRRGRLDLPQNFTGSDAA